MIRHRYRIRKGFRKKYKELWAKDAYWIVTSNVDGHFQKAGFSSEKLIEVHGSINHLQCMRPCSREIWSADTLDVNLDEDGKWGGDFPKCPSCGALARPNILMFDDGAWVSQKQYSDFKPFYQWFETLRNPVTIELGAGKDIFTIRSFSERLKAPLIRINPQDAFTYKQPSVSLQLKALYALTKLDALLQ